MKYISTLIILILFSIISTAQNSKSIPKTLHKKLLNSIAGRYAKVDVTMGYVKGTGGINIGNPNQSEYGRYNSFSFSIYVLGRKDQQFGAISDIKYEHQNTNDYLFTFDWKNDRTDQGSISGEIQLFYSLSKNRYETYFINNSSSVFNIFWWTELDQLQKDSLNSIINILNIKELNEIEALKKKMLKETIGSPIKMGNLEITQKNFPDIMNWFEANNSCQSLGNGWRLPTIDELNFIDKNKIKIVDLSKKNEFYWSFTEVTKDSSYLLNFGKGVYGRGDKSTFANVRAVRTATNKFIITNPIKIDNFEITRNDLFSMNWDDAKRVCESLGKGWRLPTKDELNLIYKNKNIIGNYSNSYWGSDEYDSDHAWIKGFFNGFRDGYFDKSNLIYVRAVKTIK